VAANRAKASKPDALYIQATQGDKVVVMGNDGDVRVRRIADIDFESLGGRKADTANKPG
jgi:hypothetical protein